jgi:hypothetical protein
MKRNIKIYAHYLPQFHETQENNIWWGKGFTEWNNVKQAAPLSVTHDQPRVPLNNYYYDLSDKKTIQWQGELAKKYGVDGFNIYHYWSSGVQLLANPVKMILKDPSIDINFNLTWANHPWVRSWKNSTGKDSMLLDQTYEVDKEDREKHYKYLTSVISDARYSRVDGKPLFSIYRTYDIPNAPEYLGELREYIHKKIGEEIHINSYIQYPPKDKSFIDLVDTVSLFQPGTAMFNKDHLESSSINKNNLLMKLKEIFINAPLPLKKLIYRILDSTPKSTKILDYDEIWKVVLNQSSEETYLDKPIIKGAFNDWDNTARYGKEATIIKGASPEKFKVYMERLIDITEQSKCSKIIFINAWNEWGESAYLEPDELNKFGYLESLRDSLNHQ